MQMIFFRLAHFPKRTHIVLMLLFSVLYATDAEAQSQVQSQPNVLSPTNSLDKADAAASFRLSIEQFNELPCSDCDGLAMGDISGNGKLDLLLSNGKGGETFWYEQGDAPETWTRHPIFKVPTAGREIEGNDLGDFNGDGQLEAISLDQRNGVIYLHAHDGDPRGQWKTVALQTDRPFLQASLVTDVDEDGRLDLIYTWEGTATGTGGVHWLQLSGDDLLDPTHWQDHVLVQHESAWWLAPGRVDLNGNGRATDIVFTARNIQQRNPGARPGVFWLEAPPDVFSTWKRHTIDDSLKHPLHVDFGDLSGNGHGQDLVVGGFETQHLYWYSFSDNWKRTDLPLPMLDDLQPDKVWNVKTARFHAQRDGILAPVNRGNRSALVYFEFTGGRHEANILKRLDYGHPMDDRIILHDIDGNGLPEAFIPDSGNGAGNSKFVWIRFGWRP